MAIKKYKPTSPGRRFMTVTDYSGLSKTAPERSLLVDLKNPAAVTLMAVSPFAIEAAKRVNTALLISSVPKTAFPLKWLRLNMIRTVLALSP